MPSPHDNGNHVKNIKTFYYLTCNFLACNDLYVGDTFVGCPTQPNVQKIWRIDAIMPVTTVGASARVRCKICC